MKKILILISLFYCINGKLNSSNLCPGCRGKIHSISDLKLAKQKLILNKEEICRNEKYKFFIIVKSGDFQRRNFTRFTWAKEIIEHFNIPVLYAIGYPTNSSIQEQILSEDKIYNDLLEFNILESYYNLTLKTTSVLYWFNQYCSNSSNYLFYVDDDVLIHVDKLIMYMYRIENNDTIEGWFEKSGKIQRKGIGGVSKKDFPIDIVPDYLWGAAVLYPSNIISNVLLNAIFNSTIPIFFRDDVFINGFIAEQAGIKRKYMEGILLHDQTEDDLKTNMIIIDFKNEDNRRKAWNCYRYDIRCNKNLFDLLLKIISAICLFTLIMIFSWRFFTTTKYYYFLKTLFQLWYYGVHSVETTKRSTTTGIQQAKLGIRWLISFKRMGLRIVFIFVFFMVLYSFGISRSLLS
jgi:hypothetical protein